MPCLVEIVIALGIGHLFVTMFLLYLALSLCGVAKGLSNSTKNSLTLREKLGLQAGDQIFAAYITDWAHYRKYVIFPLHYYLFDLTLPVTIGFQCCHADLLTSGVPLICLPLPSEWISHFTLSYTFVRPPALTPCPTGLRHPTAPARTPPNTN